jgi:shikimate dehydrogenase
MSHSQGFSICSADSEKLHVTELRLAVIGDPVANSMSPALHRAAMIRLGLEGSYEAIHVQPAELPAALDRIKALKLTGFNVTAPHKEAIVPLLDEVDAEAREMGSVNTVEIRGKRLCGHNTDRIALRELLDGERLRGHQGLLIGAGGAGTAAAFALAEIGLARLTVINRDAARANRLMDRVARRFPRLELRAGGLTDLDPSTAPAVVLHATSLDLQAGNAELLPPWFWRRSSGLAVDLAYGGRAQFLEKARTHGWRTLEGLVVLVRQGLLALQIWSGTTLPRGLDAEVLHDLSGEAE